MIERFFIFDGGESKMVLDEKIEEKLDQILKDKFKCSEEKMKTIKENGVRLLSNKIGFSWLFRGNGGLKTATTPVFI